MSTSPDVAADGPVRRVDEAAEGLQRLRNDFKLKGHTTVRSVSQKRIFLTFLLVELAFTQQISGRAEGETRQLDRAQLAQAHSDGASAS
jgi:hypothetical protein